MSLNVLVPQDQQGDVLALQLAVQHSPVRLDDAPMTLLLAGPLVEFILKLICR
jgi:hypothetical protein